MEVTKVVRRGEEGTCVNQDAESWSKLVPEICDMILEKLPSIQRVRLRVVCKDWNCSALQRVERKPYFVTFLRRSPSSYQYMYGLVVYDVVSKRLSFEPLPFKLHCTGYGYFHLAPFAVQGLIFATQPGKATFRRRLVSSLKVVKNQWCVYNIHTRTTHLLPRAPGCNRKRERAYFCGMMVDTSLKPHTFKLVVSNIDTGEKSQIYDSGTRSWSSHPKSHPNSNSSLLLPYSHSHWYFCMCHKGCMYMSTHKAVDGVFVYSMEEDQWSKLSGSPFRGKKRPFLGAWDDRIFAVLHDAGAKSVTVWELIDTTQQEWVEYTCCSKAQYEHLIEHAECFQYCMCCTFDIFQYCECCKCEIVSVFSEEYVLMYNLHLGRSYALVLLNLKTKEWDWVASIPDMMDEIDHKEWKCRLCIF